MFIPHDSRNGLKEANWYCWNIGRDGKPTNEPKDIHNHFWDAVRYGIQHINNQAPRSPVRVAGARQEW